MTIYIVPIVEGHAEAGCIERLLQRVWTDLLTVPIRLQVLPPSRGKRDALIDSSGTNLVAKVEEAHAKLARQLQRDSSGRGLLLLLLDAESDCAKELAPRLLLTCGKARSDAEIVCVLATRMLENWFVASAVSLAGINGLPAGLQIPEKVEERSGSKWLDDQMRSMNPGRKYRKTVDARAFAAVMDLQLCRDKSPSFDKLCRELEWRTEAFRIDEEPTAPPETPAPT